MKISVQVYRCQPTHSKWMNQPRKKDAPKFVPPTHHNYMQGHFRRLFSPLSRGAAFSKINNLWCIMLMMMMRTGQLVLLWMVRTNECQMSLQSGEEYKKVGLWFNLDILPHNVQCFSSDEQKVFIFHYFFCLLKTSVESFSRITSPRKAVWTSKSVCFDTDFNIHDLSVS